MKKTTEERFWDNIELIPFHSCWEWTGTKANGYGIICSHKNNKYAHRISYEIHYGEIPEGLVIDHICRNRTCVNPKHIRAVTQRINATENTTGGITETNKNKTHCKWGHEFSLENTIFSFRETRKGRTCRECTRISCKEYENRNPNRWTIRKARRLALSQN